MAEARTERMTYTRTVTEDGVVLTLTRQEAETLAAALRLIGGQPKRADGTDAARGILTDSIGAVLGAALGADYIFEEQGVLNTFETGDADGFRSMRLPSNRVAVKRTRRF